MAYVIRIDNLAVGLMCVLEFSLELNLIIPFVRIALEIITWKIGHGPYASPIGINRNRSDFKCSPFNI